MKISLVMSLRGFLSSFICFSLDFLVYCRLHTSCGGGCIQVLESLWVVVLVCCIQMKVRGSTHDWYLWIQYVCWQGLVFLVAVVRSEICSRDALRREVISKFELIVPFDPGGGCNCNISRLNCKFCHGDGMVFLDFKYHILNHVWDTNYGGRVEMELDMVLVHVCVGQNFLIKVFMWSRKYSCSCCKFRFAGVLKFSKLVRTGTRFRKYSWMVGRIFGVKGFALACMVSLSLAHVIHDISYNDLARIGFVYLVGPCDIHFSTDFGIWDTLVGSEWHACWVFFKAIHVDGVFFQYRLLLLMPSRSQAFAVFSLQILPSRGGCLVLSMHVRLGVPFCANFHYLRQGMIEFFVLMVHKWQGACSHVGWFVKFDKEMCLAELVRQSRCFPCLYFVKACQPPAENYSWFTLFVDFVVLILFLLVFVFLAHVWGFF